MERRPFIESPLRGPYQGQSAELLVAKQLAALDWRILRHNQKILGVQVDLLVRDPKGFLHIVEVKSEKALEFGLLSQRQKRRLKQVVEWMCQREPTGLLVVMPGPVLIEIQD